MTRDKAYEVASALEDIRDFEIFMDEVIGVYDNAEGNLDGFFHGKLLPLLEKEMKRRLEVLEVLEEL